MFCSRCGKEIPDAATFCPFCGAMIQGKRNEEFEETRTVENGGVSVDPGNNEANTPNTENAKQWSEETVGMFGTVGSIPAGGESGTLYAGPSSPVYDAPPVSEPNPYVPEEAEKTKSSKLLWLVVAIEVIAILVVMSGIIVMIRGNNDSGEVTESGSSQEETVSSDERNKTDEDTDSTKETITPTPVPTPTERIVTETTCYVTDSKPSDLGDYRRPSFASANASSYLVQKDHPDYDNSANSIIDGDYITSWQDGTAGNGVGESFTLNFSSDQSVKYLEFHLGNWRTDRYYNINPKPRQMTMTINGKKYPLEFTDAKISHYVVFDEAISLRTIDFIIDSVYTGSETGDCCIGEITAYAN